MQQEHKTFSSLCQTLSEAGKTPHISVVAICMIENILHLSSLVHICPWNGQMTVPAAVCLCFSLYRYKWFSMGLRWFWIGFSAWGTLRHYSTGSCLFQVVLPLPVVTEEQGPRPQPFSWCYPNRRDEDWDKRAPPSPGPPPRLHAGALFVGHQQ